MKMHFDSNLPGLLDEVLNNKGTSVLRTPIILTKKLLSELAKLAIEIDDDRLHLMMLRLGLYEFKSAADRVKQIKILERKILKESSICNSVEFGVQVYNEDMRDWMLIAVPRDYSVMQVQEITGESEPDDRTICEKLVEAWRESDPNRRYRVCVRNVAGWNEIEGDEK